MKPTQTSATKAPRHQGSLRTLLPGEDLTGFENLSGKYTANKPLCNFESLWLCGKKYLLSLLLFLPLFSCKPKVETITVNVTPLRASSIYDADAVYQYLQNHIDTNKELAEEYYKKGKQPQIDLPQAIYYIKRSLTIYPEYQHYRELADLLYQAKNYNEMNELYRFLVLPISLDSPSVLYGKYLFSAPDIDLVSNYVVSNVLANNNVWNNKQEETQLTTTLGNNIEDIKKKVLADYRVKLSAPTEENKNALWQLLTADEKAAYFNSETTSQAYKSFLKDTAKVFEIDKDLVQQFNYDYFTDGPQNDYDYFSNLDEQFGKFILEKQEKDENGIYHNEGNPRYNIERNIIVSNTIAILIYSIDTSELASPKDMRNIYHRLVTYNYDQQIIDNKIIAVQSGEELSTVKFNRNKFTITYFKRTWEKPYIQGDFDNHISKIEQTGEKSFEIKPDGKIKEVSG